MCLPPGCSALHAFLLPPACAVHQVAAEIQASTVFHHLHGHPCPVMCVPVATDITPTVGAFSVSLYAGESMDRLLEPGGELAQMTMAERLPVAAAFAASSLFVRWQNDEVVSCLAAGQHHQPPSAHTACCMLCRTCMETRLSIGSANCTASHCCLPGLEGAGVGGNECRQEIESEADRGGGRRVYLTS